MGGAVASLPIIVLLRFNVLITGLKCQHKLAI